jgi:4-alpha-glucanotransferase
LEKSFQRFKDRSSTKYPDDFYSFCDLNAFWLEDYALFMALKEVHDGRVWTSWEQGAAQRDTDALARWRNKVSDKIQFRKYVQYHYCPNVN